MFANTLTTKQGGEKYTYLQIFSSLQWYLIWYLISINDKADIAYLNEKSKWYCYTDLAF